MALTKGSKGSEVTKMQEALKSAGYYNGAVDGSFGPATDAALKSYQKANGLAVDGSFGPKTQAKLYGGSSGSASSSGSAAPSGPQALTIDKFNPNIDKDKLKQDAKDMLAPVETQQRQGYEQQLRELGSAYEQLKADIEKNFSQGGENLSSQKDIALQNIMDDTAKRNLFWSTIPSINNQKVEDAYLKGVADMEKEKAYNLSSADREYTTKEGNLTGALAQLAALIEQQATAMVPDLYNSEFGRLYQQAGLNADIDTKNWNSAMDIEKYNQSIKQFEAQMQLQRDQMAQQARLAAQSRAASSAQSSQLTALQQLGLQDKIGEAKASLLGYMPSLSKTNSKTTAQQWQNAYSQLQSQISTLPSYMQNDVNNWFKGTGWYDDYTKYGTYVAPAASYGTSGTVFGVNPNDKWGIKQYY